MCLGRQITLLEDHGARLEALVSMEPARSADPGGRFPWLKPQLFFDQVTTTLSLSFLTSQVMENNITPLIGWNE